MTHLTEDEARVLRIALGLDQTCKVTPMRNKLHPHYAARYPQAVESLMARDLLTWRARDGQAFHAATDAGRVAVLDHPWPH